MEGEEFKLFKRGVRTNFQTSWEYVEGSICDDFDGCFKCMTKTMRNLINTGRGNNTHFEIRELINGICLGSKKYKIEKKKLYEVYFYE